MSMFTCPKCGSHEWGSSNCTGPFEEMWGHCHGSGCNFSWNRKKQDPDILHEPLDLIERSRTRKKASEYQVGDPVTYIPNHANRDAGHPDCEQGHVSSIKEGVEDLIWVRFKSACGECCSVKDIR